MAWHYRRLSQLVRMPEDPTAQCALQVPGLQLGVLTPCAAVRAESIDDAEASVTYMTLWEFMAHGHDYFQVDIVQYVLKTGSDAQTSGGERAIFHPTSVAL